MQKRLRSWAMSRLGAALVLLAVSLTCMAEEPREWVQVHEEYLYEGEVVARVTGATTVDDQEPILMRDLYESTDGYLLIIHEESAGDLEDPHSLAMLLNVRSANSDENLELVFEHGRFTLTVEGESMSFANDEEPDTSEVFKNASPEFVKALRNYAEVTGSHEILFSDLVPMEGFLDTKMTQGIRGFDPNTHAPGEFEERFGRAYYERRLR